MSSSTSPRFSGFIRDVRVNKQNVHQNFSQPAVTSSTSTSSEQPSYTAVTSSTRSRANSSSATPIDPSHYQALQDTNEALKSEVHRLSRADDENVTKLKLQLQHYNELQDAHQRLQTDYAKLIHIEQQYQNLQTLLTNEKSTVEYCSRENEQLRTQNEHLLSELARLTQIETRDRTRAIEQTDLRRQLDDLTIHHNELKAYIIELQDKQIQAQLAYENDMHHVSDENLKFRSENEQLRAATDLLRDEFQQMKDAHESILKKRTDELKFLQTENRELHMIEKRYNEERQTYQTIDLRKTQLENDLLTMQAVQDRCQDLQTTVERLQTDVQLSEKKSDDHAKAIASLNKENARLIKELESASMLNTQLRSEISNATTTDERLSQECDRLRTALINKVDEFDAKRRETEQLMNKILDLETTIKLLRDTNDTQRQLKVDNETNKQELKRQQDDFEQVQRMHDTSKQEHQETIHLLEEKLHDLERKTELQSLKHEEILLEFESLKARRDRVLPSTSSNLFSNHDHSRSTSPHHWPLPLMVDSQTSPTDDSAPQRAPLLKSTGSQSTIIDEPPPAQSKLPALTNQISTNNPSVQVVIAKYSYEPLKFSPNDHPEIELPLTMGDYYLIYGDVDEDGFYDGRNLEGRYGLIPSNFIDPIKHAHELPETVRHIVQRLTGKIFPDEPISPRREPMLSIDSDVFSSVTIPTYRKPVNKVTPNSSSSETSTAPITNGLAYGKHIPCPTHLRVEKYLSNSVLIAWNAPSSSSIAIIGYQILLDHALYTTVRANERTRALIENINGLDKTHRISIRTITQRGLSRDQECTLLLTMTNANGTHEMSFIPSEMRVDRISQTSAVVSWWPASNDIAHKLFVNDIEVQTLKAGVHRFKLSGLLPNTTHKVTIKAQPPTTTTTQPMAASIEFRTTAFDESIEPPKRVQAISGPQSNTLLVSWEQASPSSSTSGYRVLVDGRQLQDVTNPLNDHTVININSLQHGRSLTVRTLTENGGESRDSNVILIDDVLKRQSDVDISSTIQPNILIPEEIFDRDSIVITPSSSLTLRTTTSDENMTMLEQIPSVTNVENHAKTPRPPPPPPPATQEVIPSPPPAAVVTPRQPSVAAAASPPIKPVLTTTAAPDKMRPITAKDASKSSPRPLIMTSMPSPSKSSSTTSSMSTDVPQIEINSPSPNSPGASTARNKITGHQHEQSQRFGYDAYMKQHDEPTTPPVKIANSPRKSSKTSAMNSGIPMVKQQRDHSDSRRTTTTTTPTNGNIKSIKQSLPRHTSTSSEEQHSMPQTPMKNVRLKEQPSTPINKSPFDKITGRPRLFIALFDYDPNEMSPNKDNEEELPFKEGQLIKIYGDKDADGFYVGETELGRRGYVPSNMVSEIQLEDAEIEEHLLAGTLNLDSASGKNAGSNRINSPLPTAKRAPSAAQPPTKPVPISAQSSVRRMVALFDYNPTELSPNVNPDEELSFRAGDIIYVHGDVLDDGFYFGHMENGKKGLVPSNFLKETPAAPVAAAMNDEHHSMLHDNDEMKRSSSSVNKSRRPSNLSITASDASQETIDIPLTDVNQSLPENTTTETAAAASSATDVKSASIEVPKTTTPTLFDRLKNTFNWNSNEPI